MNQPKADFIEAPIGPRLCEPEALGVPKAWLGRLPYAECRSPFFPVVAPDYIGGKLLERSDPALGRVADFLYDYEQKMQNAVADSFGPNAEFYAMMDRPVITRSGDIRFVMYPIINGQHALAFYPDPQESPVFEIFRSGPAGLHVALTRGNDHPTVLLSSETLREAHIHLIEKFAAQLHQHDLLQDNCFSKLGQRGFVPRDLLPPPPMQSCLFEIFLRTAVRTFELARSHNAGLTAARLDIDCAIDNAIPIVPSKSEPQANPNRELTLVEATVVRGIQKDSSPTATHWKSKYAVETKLDRFGQVGVEVIALVGQLVPIQNVKTPHAESD